MGLANLNVMFSVLKINLAVNKGNVPVSVVVIHSTALMTFDFTPPFVGLIFLFAYTNSWVLNKSNLNIQLY